MHRQLRKCFPNLHMLENDDVTNNHHRHLLHGVNSNHAVDPSGLTGTNLCTDLISEIGGELSGNRGNGNSPFNSSNSCGSPECLMTTNCCNQIQKGIGGGLSNTECRCEDSRPEKDCSQFSLSHEQNNNKDNAGNCLCSEERFV